MARKRFTDRFVQGVRPAPSGTRKEYWDALVPCLGLRVTDRGHKTYVLYRRWPNKKTATRREVGNAAMLPLADARTVAREWNRLCELGIDPHEQRRALQQDEARRKQHTFESVAEAWFREAVARMVKADEIERAVSLEFVNRWRGRPVTSITTLDIRDIIKSKALGLIPAPGAKKQGPAPAQARNLLLYVKQLFTWAVEQHAYGIDRSPADPLKGDRLIGKKNRRRRVLADEELRAVWRTSLQLGYPYGPLVRMLVLTGQRRGEVADARWSEIDLGRRLWTIPAERMKMKSAHVVPVTGDLVSLLAALPRFTRGDHLFSTNFGESSVGGFSKARERLDRLTGPMTPWVLHDLRRTMRTNLSALPIPDNVRELMIAHAQSGMHQTYDLYQYLEEKRAGFGLWHERLRGILAAENNVVALHG